MTENRDNEKVKEFLKLKYEDCNYALKKLKSKNRKLKIIYFVIILIVITGQASIAILSSISIPPIIIPIVSGFTGILTGVSSTFKLKDLKVKISQKIDEIKKLKSYIEIMNISKEEQMEKMLDEIINTLI